MIKIEPFIAWELYHKGKLVDEMPMRPCRSFVKNFYNLYFSRMAWCEPDVADDLDLRDVDGTERSSTSEIFRCVLENASTFSLRGAAGDDTQGIVVGIDDTAEDFGMGGSPAAISYALGNKVDHGNGAGQLEYQAMEEPTISITGTPPNVYYDCAWIRYFNNTRGVSNNISLNEIGIYLYNGAWIKSLMIARDKLGSTVILQDTGQFKVTYTIRVTFPE